MLKSLKEIIFHCIFQNFFFIEIEMQRAQSIPFFFPNYVSNCLQLLLDWHTEFWVGNLNEKEFNLASGQAQLRLSKI